MSPMPNIADAMEASARAELYSALLVSLHEEPERFPFPSYLALRKYLISCGLGSDFGRIIGWYATLDLLDSVARDLNAISPKEDLC